MMNHFTSSEYTDLFRVLAELDTPEQVQAFLEDVCTIKEIQDMAQRLRTAVRLSDGSSYQQIAAEIGISTATISRVSRCLNYGADGYRKAIGLLKKEDETNNAAE